MKRKLFLIMIGVCLSLAGCGNKEASAETSETNEAVEATIEPAVEPKEEVVEEETEEEKVDYPVEEEPVVESDEDTAEVEEEFEMTLELATEKLNTALIVYQENFTNMTEETGSEAERWLRSDIAECLIGYTCAVYEEIDNFDIKFKDGKPLIYDGYEEYYSIEELYIMKSKLFEKFMIEKCENNNEDFTLIDYIENTNYSDLVKDEYLDENKNKIPNTVGRYCYIPELYDLLQQNKIDHISAESIDTFNEETTDFDGIKPTYSVIFDKIFDTETGWNEIEYDEFGNIMW